MTTTALVINPQRPRTLACALRLVLFVAVAGFSYEALSEQADQKLVAGWVERVTLLPANIRIKAKLDTGAKTTSINAADLKTFTLHGKPWARFSFSNFRGRKTVIERPIVRSTTIKRHFGKYQVRPVIELEVCIGTVLKKIEVNLVDRSRLNYQMLIGRNFLKPDILVDSGRTFTLSGGCSKPIAKPSG